MKDIADLQFSDSVKYSEDHEWICLTAPYRVGISDYAQDQLGDLVYVELPEVGAQLSQGDECGSLESTKSVSPILSPVDGVVVAVNEALSDNPGMLNENPFEEGWLFEIEPKNMAQLDGLLDADAYKAFVEAEEH